MRDAYNEWSVQLFLVQAHRGEAAVLTHAMSREMYAYLDEQKELPMFLESTARSMDRKMVDFAGHLDPHRLWFSSDHERRPGWNRRYEHVYLLNGPHAGQRFVIPPFNAAFHLPHHHNVEDYRIQEVGGMRLGIHQRTSTPIAMPR